MATISSRSVTPSVLTAPRRSASRISAIFQRPELVARRPRLARSASRPAAPRPPGDVARGPSSTVFRCPSYPKNTSRGLRIDSPASSSDKRSESPFSLAATPHWPQELEPKQNNAPSFDTRAV
eukprot:scaffold57725_cov31-Tisochrysis_lutea.AAC.3